MKNTFVNIEVKTPIGKGILQQIYISELGYIMGRVYYTENKNWINYNLSSLKNIFKEKNILKEKNKKVKVKELV